MKHCSLLLLSLLLACTISAKQVEQGTALAIAQSYLKKSSPKHMLGVSHAQPQLKMALEAKSKTQDIDYYVFNNGTTQSISLTFSHSRVTNNSRELHSSSTLTPHPSKTLTPMATTPQCAMSTPWVRWATRRSRVLISLLTVTAPTKLSSRLLSTF